MDLSLLYSIPVVGLVFQLVGYLVDILPNIAPIILRAGTPLSSAALCGVMCERSGVVNIGIEGTMLVRAFTGWAVGVAAVGILRSRRPAGHLRRHACPDRRARRGGALAVVISALHAWLSISVRADQIISGTIINIAAFGVTGYLNRLIATSSPTGAGSVHPWTRRVAGRPAGRRLDFRDVPRPGSDHDVMHRLRDRDQLLLFRSRWGLRTRAVGEHPKAAETVGIDVIALRYRNVIVAGILAGLAGAYLSMEATNSFQQGMTAGRGFIALAAVIVGRWSPIGAFAAALLFASSAAIGQSISFAPPPGQLGESWARFPVSSGTCFRTS